MWEDKEQGAFIRLCRYFFIAATLGYVGHFYLYDRPMGLEPLTQWFHFRISLAAICFAAFLFYTSALATSRFSKAPAVMATWAMSYTQAMITTWWDGTPWLFSFFFVIGATIILRLSPLNSLVLAICIMATQTPFLIEAGVPTSSIISTAFVALVVTLILRSSYVADVRNFVLNQENIAAQKKIIELNIEFSDRIRAFIPRVIAERLEAQVAQNHLTMIQATVDVLRAKQANVACLFSDIRGYTAASKDLDQFIDKSVLPEVKACSNIIEDHSGIPRKIGDLIFAYFDDEDLTMNIIRCLLAATEMAKINGVLNAASVQNEVRRYILISSGNAIVGNLGGLDSSIEITALGPPVNLLSRVDELTKHPRLASLLQAGDILIAPSTIEHLQGKGLLLEGENIDLHSLQLDIRDFQEVRAIFRLKDSPDNQRRLVSFYRNYNTKTSECLNHNGFRLARQV
jgi:class 3 adenylate cyclase